MQNCTIKPPSNKFLAGRHRRLCKTCQKVPLKRHIWSDDALARELPSSFTADAFSRNACSCPEGVYLCLSCGNSTRSADVTYMRGWTWRTRYSTYLGGLGTGIGEGNEGVLCGRGPDCLAAREIEQEIDCDAEELAKLASEDESADREGRHRSGTSYMAQEIEGIGGIVKKKVKKRIKVGQVVKEYEDERENGDYLGREKSGSNRSWCHWCLRVIPGQKDARSTMSDLGLELTNSSSSSVKSTAS